MTLSRVNAGHVVGQVVLIADQMRKNGFEVSGARTNWPSIRTEAHKCIGLTVGPQNSMSAAPRDETRPSQAVT
ncbi:MAG: hypothetical protein K0S58_1284 [Nitrospira sp.]|nr:hypothetical protein [Nitrospira sp.]